MTSTPRLSNQAPREFSCTRVMWEMIEITYDIISNVDTSIMLIVYGTLGVMLMTLQIFFAGKSLEFASQNKLSDFARIALAI